MNRARASLRMARSRAESFAARLFEERYLGVSTGGEIRPQELGYAHGLYRASSWLVLRELFRSLEVAEEDVIVDIGSGMGRVLFVAARRPFKRVIGVERSGRLNEVARGLIESNRHRLVCQEIELARVEALEWEIPEDLTVVYLYCPFPDPVFAQLVERLLASVDRAPRPLRVIYFFSTPQDREVLMATGRARRIDVPVPRYLRSHFAELSMFRLLPSEWSR